MKRSTVSPVIAVIGTAVLFGGAIPPAAAQVPPQIERLQKQLEARKKLEEEMAAQKASKTVARPLNQAREAAVNEKWDEALKHLDAAKVAEGRTPADEYLINELTGFVLHRKGDSAGAAAAYEKSFATGLVPADKQPARLKMLSQLYFETKDYPKAADFGQRQLEVAKEPDPEFLSMVARAQYLADKHPEFLKTSDRIMADTRTAGKPVEEMWYQMRLNSYVKLQDNAGVVAQLEQLSMEYPKKQYWGETFRLMKRQPGMDPRVQHNLYRLMYDTKLLQSGQDIVQWQERAMKSGLPGEALAALQLGKELNIFTGDNNMKVEQQLTAEAQKAAAVDKKGMAELETSARASKDGEVDVQLGYSLFSYGQFEKAAEAIQRGLKKGGAKNAAEANLMLGRAYMKADRKAEAQAAFEAVAAGAGSADKVQAQLANLAKFYLAYLKDPAALA